MNSSFPKFSADIRRIEDLDYNGKIIHGDVRFSLPPFIADAEIRFVFEIEKVNSTHLTAPKPSVIENKYFTSINKYYEIY